MAEPLTGTTPFVAVQVTDTVTDEDLVAAFGVDLLGPITADTARLHILDHWLVKVCGQLQVLHPADVVHLDPDRLDPADEHAHQWGIYCGLCQAPRPAKEG